MNRKITTAALLLGTLLLAGNAYADCPGPFMRDVKRAYENAKNAESQGRKESALYGYHAAQGSVCEGANPYEADAAKRASPLALELGTAAEKSGDFEEAAKLYDAGGHYAAADRAYMQTVRAKPDNPGAYEGALGYFRGRSEEWFTANNSAAIKVAGAYKQDPKFMAEVNAMPAKGIERATQKEASTFNEEYLRDYVQAVQARSDDVTDAAAIQRTISAQQAFGQKWKQGDLVKQSSDALENLQAWGRAVQAQDPKLAATVAAKVAQLAEQRATTLRQKYFGAPQFLDEAMDYYRVPGGDETKEDLQIAAVRTQALKLGDEANTRNRYQLAAAYYEVARKAMQEQQATSKANNKKAAADLEKELGL